jgi:GAF domain-containing protein
MRLMAKDRAEREGRFGSGRPRVAPVGFADSGYGGLVLERLARHTCRIAGVDWSCIFVRDVRDPRLAIAAAGHGVPWDLIGTRIGSDEGVVGQVLVSGKPAVLADYRALVGTSAVEDEEPRPGIAVPIWTGESVGGVLCAAIVRYDRQFDEHDLEMLTELA